MDINKIFAKAGKDKINADNPSPEAWALVDKLKACPNDKERARMMDHIMNEIVAAVISRVTGKPVPPIRRDG